MKFKKSFQNLKNLIKKKYRIKSLKKALFLHIQKTAGTSILHYAHEKYNGSYISHGDYLNMDVREINKKAFVSGHFGFSYSEKFLKSRYSFTFLRNPIERILSLYYFCRNQKCTHTYPIYRLAQDLDLKNFLQVGLKTGPIKPYIWNNQTWNMAYGYANPSGLKIEDFNPNQLLEKAIANLEKLSYIGFTESFNSDIKIIANELGLYIPEKIIKENVTPKRPTANDLPLSVLDLLNELTIFDRRLYNYSWEVANN